MSPKHVIGYWLSDKKRQKCNWQEFHKLCEIQGFHIKMIDIHSDLDSQGPFDVIVHKLSDVLALAQYGDPEVGNVFKAQIVILRLQNYINNHPRTIVIDPLENVSTLHCRHKTYEIINKGLQLTNVFAPNFVDIRSQDATENQNRIEQAGVKYPFLCKPLLAHGSSNSHKLMVIFNERGLLDCQPPYLAQDFINHNAIVYKLFIVGNKYHVVERPSLKNFYPEDCKVMDTIFFSSHDTCKVDSSSKWSILSESEVPVTTKPNNKLFEIIVDRVKELFQLTLAGIDVVIENHTGRYAIIDINVFPGYDGYPNFYQHLIDTIKNSISLRDRNFISNKNFLNEDLDSGFESDEKKNMFSTLN